jgi:glutamate 5-kinase
VDGLYDDDPKENPNANLVKTIREITPEIEMLSNKKNSEHGSGGIETKIKAAKVCLNNNCNTIIANGMNDRPISIMKKSDNYTIFLANENA